MPGLNTDTNFEKSLSDLAYSSLQDKTPALLDYLVGFQVVDVNEDQTKAVGVFGCKVGEEWIYMPIFFMNGELKDGLMYLKNQDIFVPQTESWVSYILNRKPHQMGESTKFTNRDIAMSGPDLLRMRNSPRLFGKSAGASVISAPSHYISVGNKVKFNIPCFDSQNLQKWAEPCDLALRNASEKKAEALDLIEFLKQASPLYTHCLIKEMVANKGFCTSVLQYHSQEKLATLRQRFTKRAAEGPNIPDVRIVSYNEIKNPWTAIGMTEQDTSKLMQGQIVIKDNRGDKEVSKVYNCTQPMNAQSINETGVFELFTTDGELLKVFAVVSPIDMEDMGNQYCGPCKSYGSNSKQLNNVLLINLDGKGCRVVTADMCFGRPIPKDFMGATYDADSKELKSLDSIREGNCYSIISNRGTGTGAFHVLRKQDRADGNTTLYVTTSLQPSEYVKEDWANRSQIVISSDKTGKLQKIGNTLYVTQSCRVVPIDVPEAKKDMPIPGDPRHIEQYLWRNGSAVPMKLYSNGTEYQITTGPADASVKSASYVPYRGALNQLIYQHGIRGDTAEALLKSAAAKSCVKVMVMHAEGYPNWRMTKRADPYGQEPYLTGQGAYAPAMQEDSGISYDNSISAPTQAPMSMAQNIQGLMPQPNAAQIYNPNPQLDIPTQQLAQESSETGQKEVFDTAVIAGLVKAVDNDSMIDKYIGDLIVGLDRIGRIYFLFLQHNDKFKERYGQSDLVELEDSLKNTFKGMGELIMFLKQKTVEKTKSLDKNNSSINDDKNK